MGGSNHDSVGRIPMLILGAVILVRHTVKYQWYEIVFHATEGILDGLGDF